METIESLRGQFRKLEPHLNEKTIRLWAALEARKAGWGGVTLVHQATGLSRSTITTGIQELKSGKVIPVQKSRVRRSGGGRKGILEIDPKILLPLKKLVASTTRGDPQSPLLWTCKSTRKLARELAAQGQQISHPKVADLLKHMGYSLQANRKTREGSSHPDRNAQFEYINSRVKQCQLKNQPVVSVDTKKKELIGDFRNPGKEWRPKGEPEEVQVHDFQYKDLGKGVPYGVYDIHGNEGWVSVGTDHDTAEFAVSTLETWWKKMGSGAYPDATELMITADGGGSNGSRCKLWKLELARFAKASGLKITVSHLPPGTSKWNKIEHRMFSYITQNWRGRPLVSHQTMVNLIGSTMTQAGLKIRSGLDNRAYEIGIKVSSEEIGAIKIQPHAFHGDWNYTILP